jgi:NUMOD3 motif
MQDFMPKGFKGFQKGHSVPEYLRRKWSIDRMGRTSPRKGVTLSEETKRRISDSLNAMPEELKIARIKKMADAHLGKKQSPELIQKRVEARRGYRHSPETIAKIIAGHRNSGRPHKTDESKIWRRRIEYSKRAKTHSSHSST